MTKQQPKISVIIPSLNQGRYIEEAIVSVISQDYPSFELLVIDGGSSDESVAVIRKYADRIRYWISEKDSGQSHAINKGLARAEGDIITWLNSDDAYEPGVFRHVVDLFQRNPGAGIVHGKVRLYGSGKKTKIAGLSEDLPVYDYLAYMRFPQPASFFSGAALKDAGLLDESLHYAMDFDFVAKVVLAGYPIVRTDALLASYRLHETSKSNEELKFLSEWTQVFYGILEATGFGESFSRQLQESTGIIRNKILRYQSRLPFSKELAGRIFLLHLDVHFHYQYTALNIPQLQQLAGYLRKNHPEIYKTRQYGKYLRRLKILPTFVIRFIRKFSR